jgi:hypothetical protein
VSPFTKISAIVAVVLLGMGITALLWAQTTFHRYGPKIWQSHPAFKEGFSFTHSFTVDVSAPYYIGIRYRRFFRVTPTQGVPPDEFSAEYTITSGGTQVAHGDNSSDRHAWISNKDSLTGLLGPFDLQRNQSYDVSLQISHVDTTLASTAPTVMLVIDSLTEKGATIAGSFLSVAGFAFVVVGIFFIMPLCGFLIRRRSDWAPGDI